MACLPRNGYVVIYSLEEIKRKFSLLTKNTVEVYYLTVIQMFERYDFINNVLTQKMTMKTDIKGFPF